MPRAGPLRYWSLTLFGLIIGLGAAAAFGWGLLNLIDTGTCGSGEPSVAAPPCPDDTVWHILAVALAPFVAPLAVVAWALRGGATKPVFSRLRRREKRLADRIARGEAAMPAFARPPSGPPVPPLVPAAPPVPAREPSESPIERLNGLARMKDRGLLTEAEFEAEKKRILGGI